MANPYYSRSESLAGLRKGWQDVTDTIQTSRAQDLQAEQQQQQVKRDESTMALQGAQTDEITDKKGLAQSISALSLIARQPDLQNQNQAIQMIASRYPDNQDIQQVAQMLEGSSYEETQATVAKMMEAVRAEQLNRGFYETPKAQQQGTIVRTVMVEGKPTDVLYNEQTGELIRVLGEAEGKSAGVNVNVGKQESEFAKGMGQNAADLYAKNQAEISNNEAQLKQVSTALQLAEKEGVDSYQGLLGQYKGIVADVASSLGIPTEDRDAAQQLDGILTSRAIQARVVGSGPDTDKDFQNRKDALGSMGNNPAALKGKLKLSQSVLEHRNKYMNEYNRTLAQNGGDLAATDSYMSQWEKQPENKYVVPSLQELGVSGSSNNQPVRRATAAELRAKMQQQQTQPQTQRQAPTVSPRATASQPYSDPLL